jgi:hypothetical protein
LKNARCMRSHARGVFQATCSVVPRRAYALPLREETSSHLQCDPHRLAFFTVRSRRANSAPGFHNNRCGGTWRRTLGPPVSERGVETGESELRKRQALRPHRLKPVTLKRAGEEVRNEASFYAGVLRPEGEPFRLSEDFSTSYARFARRIPRSSERRDSPRGTRRMTE